jgi:ferredoxin
MADKTKRFKENASGRYYVDDQCIDCDACRTEAPQNFARNEAEGHSFVKKQPETDLEREQCEAARSACPVEAIGDDNL